MARKSYDLDLFKDVKYSENSPTGLVWKNEFRKGKGGVPTKRVSLSVGSFDKQNCYFRCTLNGKVFQNALIVLVLNGYKLPDDCEYKVEYIDGNPKNLSVNNLRLQLFEKDIPKYSDKIRDFIEYDESSSTFLRWKCKASSSSNIKVGDEAGGIDIDSNGYYNVTVGSFRYKIHRLVYWLYTGEDMSDKLIDHIDGNPSNNHIDNLRLGCRYTNARNRKKGSNNSTGYNGITYSEYIDHRGTLIRKYVYKSYQPDGKTRSYSFSVNKYGEDLALQLILQKQKEVLLTIGKTTGIVYTERHGK